MVAVCIGLAVKGYADKVQKEEETLKTVKVSEEAKSTAEEFNYDPDDD